MGERFTRVLNNDHQQGADKGTSHCAAATSQRRTADNGSSDGVHVVAVTGIRHSAENTASKHHGADAVDQAGQGVDHVEGLADLDAGKTGNIDTGADDKQVTAKIVYRRIRKARTATTIQIHASTGMKPNTS